jgi:hypothetical protein
MASNEKAGRGNLKSLNGLGWKIHDHLREHRPKMFRKLKAERRLTEYLLEWQNTISRQLMFLEDQGMYPHEAKEMLRDEIYLPSEEDMPRLGEARQPYCD